jgi:hypothetical protein
MSTAAVTGRDERMRAGGPVERDVGRLSATHSINWVARNRREGGIASPRALAVFRLITNWKMFACSTGSSLGFRAPEEASHVVRRASVDVVEIGPVCEQAASLRKILVDR